MFELAALSFPSVAIYHTMLFVYQRALVNLDLQVNEIGAGYSIHHLGVFLQLLFGGFWLSQNYLRGEKVTSHQHELRC